MLPICLPFILLVAIALPRVAPSLEPTFVNRVLKSNSSDVNVEWRQAAAGALWQQVRESPINGVGFGKTATFRFAGTLETITQDPHDSFLYLLAGGGILALSGFLLLLVTFAADAVGQLRRGTDPYKRLIVLWSTATLFTFLVNAATAPVLSDPIMLLTTWTVMLLPSSIRRAPDAAVTRMPARAAAPRAA
jgi:O-antigen ligase